MKALKRAFPWDWRWKYSGVFGPHEARQQLGCPLFLLDEWAPPYKATPKMGCWDRIHKTRRVTFCLSIFSSPDNKHNIALSSNYDLRMLHNTKHMIFFPVCSWSWSYYRWWTMERKNLNSPISWRFCVFCLQFLGAKRHFTLFKISQSRFEDPF